MSKLQEAPQAFTFDDMVLVPQYSKVKSRKDPDISVNVPGFKYRMPIVSSPMSTVTETEMIVTMAKLGGVGVLHRYMSIEFQVKVVKEVQARLSDAGGYLYVDNTPPFYVAVGANGDCLQRVQALLEAGVIGFCVDVANGHNELSVEAVRAIRNMAPTARIMAGNVCTYGGAHRLAEAGANSIRVGIGGGSMCTTRQVTGHGVPQLSAIEDCVRIKTKQVNEGESFECKTVYFQAYPDVAIIADGGIRKSSDIIKSLAIGADAVMLGGLLAGTLETPGEWLDEEDGLYKYYHGMASDEGREKWFKKAKSGTPAEGVSKKILYRGRSAAKVIEGLCASTKIGLSFSGAMSVAELKERARWRRITRAGYTEGTPHGK